MHSHQTESSGPRVSPRNESVHAQHSYSIVLRSVILTLPSASGPQHFTSVSARLGFMVTPIAASASRTWSLHFAVTLHVRCMNIKTQSFSQTLSDVVLGQDIAPAQPSTAILVHKLHCRTYRILSRDLGLTSMLERIVGSQTLDLRAQDRVERVPRCSLLVVEIISYREHDKRACKKIYATQLSHTCRRVLTSWARIRCP